MRILVAEDDVALRSVLQRSLREAGYVVDATDDGDAALRYLQHHDYDVAVLDWRMPKKSGLEVLEEARRRGDRTPILMLTARDTTADRVAGLNSGADDYLVKPFELSELFARLLALQRRPPLTLNPIIDCADLNFNSSTRELTLAGVVVPLTSTETALVELFMRRSPSVVTRRMIATHVWEDQADTVGSNTIEVHVRRIRSKLSSSRARLETVRGSGYRLVAP